MSTIHTRPAHHSLTLLNWKRSLLSLSSGRVLASGTSSSCVSALGKAEELSTWRGGGPRALAQHSSAGSLSPSLQVAEPRAGPASLHPWASPRPIPECTQQETGGRKPCTRGPQPVNALTLAPSHLQDL